MDQASGSPSIITQAYIETKDDSTIRLRRDSKKGCFITIKGKTVGVTRQEFEYPIPEDDFYQMVLGLNLKKIHKTRYRYIYEGNLWEIDEFMGPNEGLVIAEIELKFEDQVFEKPDFVVNEVSDDSRYYNVNLIDNPYKNW